MEQIIAIAQALAKQGKTPNTALIKARLPKNTPLPMIIAGLKKWQENPQQVISSVTEANAVQPQITEQASIEQLIAQQIEQALLPLQDQISALQKQVTALQKSQNTENK